VIEVAHELRCRITSDVGSKAENICSQRGFRILTQLGTLLISAMIILRPATLEAWMSKSAAESVQAIQPGKTYIGKQGFGYSHL
jgi:hypothetical protein